MSEVARVLTPLTEVELARVLHYGHDRAFGTLPSHERLGVAWAQCALELARGKKIWNHNLGNITSAGQSGDWYTLRVPPPDPPVLKFRAHATSLLGAEDYWNFLQSGSRGRFSVVLHFFNRGDALGAAQELGRLHYFLADVTTYANAMASLYIEFGKRHLAIDAVAEEHPEVPSPEELASTGRLWRLIDDLDAGREGIDTLEGISVESTQVS